MESYQERLNKRYIPPSVIDQLLPLFKSNNRIKYQVIGSSVEKRDIISLTLGNGPYKILCWSQMHGNESTTTKMLMDVALEVTNAPKDSLWEQILSSITLVIIPILNPDGAYRFTRENANKIDLNRDANELSQPESRVLRELYNTLQPNLCLNMHGQRSIYGLSEGTKPAAVSFLAPAANAQKAITKARTEAMHLICGMNSVLQKLIPGQVGRYDDTYNSACVGDTFTSLDTPTILFEAGLLGQDYRRNNTRDLLYRAFKALLLHLAGIAPFSRFTVADYQAIPENVANYDDVHIIYKDSEGAKAAKTLRVKYNETLEGDQIILKPELIGVQSSPSQLAHRREILRELPDSDLLDIEAKKSEFIEEYLVKFLRL